MGDNVIKYSKEIIELRNKKAIYLDLKKGPRVFNKDDIPALTEFSTGGEVMQSALLSIKLSNLYHNTPKNVQANGNARILKQEQNTRNSRTGGSLKKTKKGYKK